MDNEVLIKALSAIANVDGSKVELNAKACKLLAKYALEAAQPRVCIRCGAEDDFISPDKLGNEYCRQCGSIRANR